MGTIALLQFILKYIMVLLLIGETVSVFLNFTLFKSLKKFDSPSKYPIIGNLLTYLSYGKDVPERLKNISTNIFHARPTVIWFSYAPFVVISKFEDLQVIMNKTSHRYFFGFFEKFVGNGIFSKGYKEWYATRRILNPAFSPSMLVQYLNVFNEQYSNLVDTLKERINNETFDVWPYMINTTVSAIVDIGLQMVERPWLFAVPYLFKIYTYFTGDYKHIEELRRLPSKALLEKKREIEASRKQTYGDSKIEKTALDVLFKAHQQDSNFTEEHISTEILHLLIGGSESTALIGSFLLLHLGIFQDIQQKVYDEIRLVCKDAEKITMHHLYRLKYTEQCIKETIRLYPSLPMTFRSTLEDIPISDDKTIPAHCQIFCMLNTALKNEKLYTNPELWNPENFSEVNVAKRPKNSFLGFGLGPRACIGSKYGMIALKTQICYLLRNFHVSTDVKFEDIEVVTDFILRSKNGYPIRLKVRHDI